MFTFLYENVLVMFIQNVCKLGMDWGVEGFFSNLCYDMLYGHCYLHVCCSVSRKRAPIVYKITWIYFGIVHHPLDGYRDLDGNINTVSMWHHTMVSKYSIENVHINQNC